MDSHLPQVQPQVLMLPKTLNWCYLESGFQSVLNPIGEPLNVPVPYPHLRSSMVEKFLPQRISS